VSEGNPAAPGNFGPGSQVAGYRIEEQIGAGGMAVVFRAYDERLERTVALKILSPALAADDAFRQRFIRESRAAASVDDPHIIPVYEAGDAGGVLFIAMRFVSGGDVRSLVSQLGPLPPGRAAEIISQVASALDAAHGRGLVHRDVKPANMLLSASARAGASSRDHVYLSDFGLSKGSLQASGLTGTGTFLGTLDYISPEQIEGKPVDGRADEYALACAAFELLAGVPPFQRDEAMAVMYAQLSEPPPPLTSHRPDLPPAVDGVFGRALAKAPADRYGSCREFSDALYEALGIMPHDSGPGRVPSGEHPMTQVVRPSGPGPEPTSVAPVGPAGSGWDSGGGRGAGDARTSGGAAGGWGGQAGVGGQATQVAGSSHGTTSPDLTDAHVRGGGPGGPGGSYGGGPYGGGQPGRRRRSPVMLAVVVVVVLALGGGGAYLALHHKTTTPPHHTVALSAPGCSAKAAAGGSIASAKGAAYPVQGGEPFGLVPAKDGKFLFVFNGTSAQVYKVSPADGTLTFAWSYTFAVPDEPATTAVPTHNGRYIMVATANGIDVLSTAIGESGASGSMQVGSLQVPNLPKYERAIGVAVSPDDKFAFVTLQYSGQLAVFNLNGAAASGDFSGASYVGSVSLGKQPVGVTASPDGQSLYVTSFKGGSQAGQGLLSTLSMAKAETDPAGAVVSQVDAGCNPARIVVSPDSKTVWVSTRQSNELLAYSAASLAGSSSASKALIAEAQVGQTPIGMALVNGGSRMVVADTDMQAVGASSDNLAVLSTSAILAGKKALLGYIPSGLMPHELAVSPNGKYLYVTDNGSAQVQVVNLSKLP